MPEAADTHTYQVTPAVVTDKLSRRFSTGRRRKRTTIDAVQDISFKVDSGERLAFIGPNGAGKSTSIKMLTGILHPSSGSARVLGLVPWDERMALTRRIGALFGQRSQLWSELAPSVSFGLLGAIFGLSGEESNRRVGELGELLDATELFAQPVRTLSLGQRMRCELAACMLHRPEMLFLDEPTIGLDLLGKQLFRKLLLRLNRELGTTVFLTSHDVADIEHVANRAIIVNHGSIIYDAPVATMRRELLASKRIEIRFAEPVDTSTLATIVGDGATVAPDGPTQFLLDVDTTVRSVSDVLDAVLRSELGAVADLSVFDPPLEQVISEIYQRPA